MAESASAGRRLGALVMAGALAVACQPTETSSPPPDESATVGSPSPALSPTPIAGPIRIVWADQPFDGTVSAVAADLGQFVAVGGTNTGLSAWTSGDGTNWTAHPVSVPIPQQLGLDPIFAEWMTNPQIWPPLMGRMARFGDTLLSFGTFYGPIDYLRPVGWRTTDLVTWEFIESTNVFFTNGYAVMDLVGSGDELVAANHGFGMHTGGTWRWTPATSWMQTTPTNTDYTQSSVDILDAVWANGQFVAVGERAIGSAVSWVSADGQSWQESPTTPELATGIMRSVAMAPDGSIVAVGNLAGVPTAWTSTDGLTWTSMGLPGGGSAVVYGVAQLDTGLLAIADDVTGVLTWTSHDGVAWHAGPTLAGSVQQRLEVGGENFVAKGTTVILFSEQGSEPNLHTVLWVGQIQP